MYQHLFPVNWQAFHFLRPQLLWLIVPLLLTVIFGLLTVARKEKWQKVIAPHLRPYVILKGSQKSKFLMNMLMGLLGTLMILALAGPAWKKINLPDKQLESPFIILLDLSQSMMANDFQPNRLQWAKFKIQDLLDLDVRAQTALIGYAGTAHTIVPLSEDYRIIDLHLEGIKPTIMPLQGSDLNRGLQQVDSLLQTQPLKSTILLMTDEIAEPQVNLLQQYVLSHDHRLIVFPVATTQGSEIPQPMGRDVFRDQAGEPVRSALQQQWLQQLSGVKNIEVVQPTLDNSDIEKIAKAVRTHLKYKDEPQTKDDWQDAGLPLLVPAAFLLLFWFRKGWVLYTLPLLLLMGCQSKPDFQFRDLWLTRDYQAQKRIAKGDYEGAAKLYEEPIRKGIAYFKGGDYERAIAAFQQDTSTMGQYNLALSYLKNGDSLSAQILFQQVAENDSSFAPAQYYEQMLDQYLLQSERAVNLDSATEVSETERAKNKQNDSMEDLGGGGQEAKKEDMKKERLEETVGTDTRKAKELDEVPDDFQAEDQAPDNAKVMLQKVDDDPANFLKKKFRMQFKKYKNKSADDDSKW